MKIILIVSCCAELLVQTVGTNKDDCHDTLSIVLTSIMILWAYSYIVPCDDLSIHVCHINWILWDDLHYNNVCVEPCDDVYCVRTVCCLPAQVRVLCIIYQYTSLLCTDVCTVFYTVFCELVIVLILCSLCTGECTEPTLRETTGMPFSHRQLNLRHLSQHKNHHHCIICLFRSAAPWRWPLCFKVLKATVFMVIQEISQIFLERTCLGMIYHIQKDSYSFS